MIIDKEGVYRTRGGEFQRVKANTEDVHYPWIEVGGFYTWKNDGVHCGDDYPQNLTHYVCPLQSVAPPEVHWQYREMGLRVREVGEVIQRNDYMYTKDATLPYNPIESLNTGNKVERNDGNYYLEPLAKQSPPMESDAQPIPEPQSTAEVAFRVGDVVVSKGDYCSDLPKGYMTLVKANGCINDAIGDERIPHIVRTHTRHSTPDERRKFFALNPQLHPAHRQEHGDMKGWRYLEIGEGVKKGDEFWNYYQHTWSNFGIYGDKEQNNSGHPYRRRVDADGNDIKPEVEPVDQPQPEPWKPTTGEFVKVMGYGNDKCKFIKLGESRERWLIEFPDEERLWCDEELSPWIDPPHAVAEFVLNGDKYRAERWGKDEPVYKKVEVGE